MNTIDRYRRILFVSFALLVNLVGPFSMSFAAPLKVVFVKGKVTFLPSGHKKYQVLKKGMAVEEGTTVKTSKDSLALLKNKDLTTKIIQNSRVKIESTSTNAKASVKKGGALFRFIKKKVSNGPTLTVKTKTASVGVRGTTFMVYSGQKNNSILSVKKGLVDFKGSSSVSDVQVGAGKSTMTNQRNQNLRPRNFGLQKNINWSLKSKGDLSQPPEFFTAAEKLWDQYKKEQEYIWKNYKQDQEQKWKNFINN